MVDSFSDVWLPSTLQPEVAIDKNDWITAEATADYWWAWCHVLRQEIPLVYDLGCQTGYGSRILVEQNKARVVGYDANAAALAYARGEYQVADRNTFHRIDFNVEWRAILEKERPKLIVAFDLLPRLKHRDLFLLNLAELVPDDGWVFLSAWHLEEQQGGVTALSEDAAYRVLYRRDQLRQLLQRFFEEVFVRDDEGFPEPGYFDYLYAYAAKSMTGVSQQGESFAQVSFGRRVFACHKPRRSR